MVLLGAVYIYILVIAKTHNVQIESEKACSEWPSHFFHIMVKSTMQNGFEGWFWSIEYIIERIQVAECI